MPKMSRGIAAATDREMRLAKVKPQVGIPGPCQEDRDQTYEEQVAEFRMLLNAVALKSYEIDLLLKLFADNQTLHEVCKKLGYTSRMSALRHRDHVLRYLRPILISHGKAPK